MKEEEMRTPRFNQAEFEESIKLFVGDLNKEGAGIDVEKLKSRFDQSAYQLMLSLPRAFKELLDEYCKEKGITLDEMVSDIIKSRFLRPPMGFLTIGAMVAIEVKKIEEEFIDKTEKGNPLAN